MYLYHPSDKKKESSSILDVFYLKLIFSYTKQGDVSVYTLRKKRHDKPTLPWSDVRKDASFCTFIYSRAYHVH